MRTVLIRCSVVLGVLAVPLAATAQNPVQNPKVGYLLLGSEETGAAIRQAFVDGLRELGYVDGRNIALDFRYGGQNAARLDGQAQDLVRSNVDVIVVGSTPAFLAARKATPKIPIVFATIGDPVGFGVVDSLSRPGRNFTGLTIMSEELNAKRLELIKQIMPGAKRIGMLEDPDDPMTPLASRGIEAAAQSMGLTVIPFGVHETAKYAATFAAMGAQGIDAVLVLDEAAFSSNRRDLAATAAPQKLPLICPYAQMTEAGCLCSYGVNILENFRQSGVYVDKILKGANPADLPIENPRRFQTVINLKTAEELGLTIPELVRLRADLLIR